jgi:hypothetical protein
MKGFDLTPETLIITIRCMVSPYEPRTPAQDAGHGKHRGRQMAAAPRAGRAALSRLLVSFIALTCILSAVVGQEGGGEAGGFELAPNALAAAFAQSAPAGRSVDATSPPSGSSSSLLENQQQQTSLALLPGLEAVASDAAGDAVTDSDLIAAEGDSPLDAAAEPAAATNGDSTQSGGGLGAPPVQPQLPEIAAPEGEVVQSSRQAGSPIPGRFILTLAANSTTTTAILG